MELDFVKMHGSGNDFVFIDDFSRDVQLTECQIRQMCDRHTGIGADGVVLVRPSTTHDCAAYMHHINADGSLSSSSGNAMLCLAKYLVDRGFVSSSDGFLVIDALSGLHPVDFTVDENEKVVSATVDMGHPVLEPADVPVALPANATSSQGVAFVQDAPISSPWGEFSFTCVSMGNPHAVCFVEDWNNVPDELFLNPFEKNLNTFDFERVARHFESVVEFPEKTNVEFACVDGTAIAMRMHERGYGETLSCGSGACAVLVAASLTERAKREAAVAMQGGTLRVLWNDSDHVLVTGPAAESFQGSLEV